MNKCDSARWFLQCNLRGCSRQTKEASYKTFVRPIAEYACSTWDPHRRNKDAADKLEAMQKRAARFVHSDWRRTSSITAMLAALQWQSLQHRRNLIKLRILHSIINGLIAVPHCHLAPPPLHIHNTRHATAGKFLHATARTHYQSTFFPSAAALWNGLDRSITTQADAELFQGQLALVQFH